MIVVDPIHEYPASMTTDKGLPGRFRCHCTSDIVGDDGRAELLEFARRLGCNLAWKQKWESDAGFHFDLTRSMRLKAVRFGAREVDERTVWVKVYATRAEFEAAIREKQRPVFGITPPPAEPKGCMDGGGRMLR